ERLSYALARVGSNDSGDSPANSAGACRRSLSRRLNTVATDPFLSLLLACNACTGAGRLYTALPFHWLARECCRAGTRDYPGDRIARLDFTARYSISEQYRQSLVFANAGSLRSSTCQGLQLVSRGDCHPGRTDCYSYSLAL